MKRKLKIEVFRSFAFTDSGVPRGRQYYWRLVSSNGRYVACSGEGYQAKLACKRMAMRLFPGVELVEVG